MQYVCDPHLNDPAVKDKYIAEDILQDVFIKTLNIFKQKKYNEQGKFLPWILRVAHRKDLTGLLQMQMMMKPEDGKE